MNKKYLLQLGLAFVLIYSGVDALINPNDWLKFIPSWVAYLGLSKILVLHIYSAFQIILGLALLFKYKVKTMAIIAATHFVAIIAATGFGRDIFMETFRNIGLFFMALYLGVRGRY